MLKRFMQIKKPSVKLNQQFFDKISMKVYFGTREEWDLIFAVNKVRALVQLQMRHSALFLILLQLYTQFPWFLFLKE